MMDREINTPDNGNNFLKGINTTGKHYLKEQMELIGKSASNDTSKIGFLPNSS